jgi:hypothetical protein
MKNAGMQEVGSLPVFMHVGKMRGWSRQKISRTLLKKFGFASGTSGVYRWAVKI